MTGDIIDRLKDIESNIGHDFNPHRQKVLRFLNTNLDRLKVVILGQDPYPEKNRATGRAFEVGGLKDWNSPFRQVSLKNILRLIHKNYTGIEEYRQIKKYAEIAGEIRMGKFRILPPDRLFGNLEKQGVLFLNTSFTCQTGKPNSHAGIWKSFAERLLSHISTQRPDLIWFLWGNKAQSNKKYIRRGFFYESQHPMLCSEKYDNDFLKSGCFKETMHIVDWPGIN